MIPSATSQARPVAPEQKEVGAFFGLLAARFAHERAETLQPKPLPVAKPKAAKRTLSEASRRQRKLVWLTTTLVCLLLIAVATLPGLLSSATVPDDILGTWRTSAKGYANRGFTITPTSLVLNAGADGKQVSTHPITRVRMTSQGRETICAIEYLVDGAQFELSLRYSAPSPSVIHLSHQRELEWSKDPIGG